MPQQNRPFSIQNIVDALQTAGVKKAGAERALASLLAKGTVTKKEYGKINIFLLAQSTILLPDTAEMETVDAEVKDLTAKIHSLDEELAGLNSHVAELQSVRTLSEAIEENKKIDAEIAAKEAKLAMLGDGSALLTKEQKFEVESAYYQLLTAWKKRKKIVKNISDVIGESSGMKTQDFYEEVGVELDEDSHCTMEDFPDIPDPSKPARKEMKRSAKRQKIS